MKMFRKGTLYDLLAQVPSTIGRMARPNNIIERNRQKRRNTSVAYDHSKSNMRVNDGSIDGSIKGDGNGLGLQRRGTVNLVKNFMFQKIQKAQQNFDGQSNFGGSGADGSNRNIDYKSRINNMSQAAGGMQHSRLDLNGGNGRGGNFTPSNQPGNDGLNFNSRSLYPNNDNRNLRTGAPVDYDMLPEENDNVANDQLL